MIAEQLKKAILQAAIQGKLTEQLPEDGDARGLLKEIQKEKALLLKEGKIKKEKLPDEIFEEEIPFDIPDNWCWARLDELTEVISKGTTPSGGKNSYLSAGIGFIRAENVAADGKVKTDNLMYIDAQTHETILKRSVLSAKDLLISIAGTLGRTAVVEETQLPLNCNQAVSFVRLVNQEIISVYYLQKAISSFPIQQFLLQQTKVTAIPNLTLEIISKCIIPLPPLAEQKRIVNIIEVIFAEIDVLKNDETKLEVLQKSFPKKMKDSILQYAVQGKLVEQRLEEGTGEELYQQILDEKQRLIKARTFKKEKPIPEITEDEKPFDIPESWRWVRLPEVGELNRGRSQHRPRNDSSLYINGTTPMIQTGDVARANLYITDWSVMYNEVGVAQSRIWKEGTICLTIAANIGDVAILKFDACFPDSVVGFNAYNPMMSNEYFMYGLMCYKSILDTMSRSTAQKNINIDILSKIVFPLPPLAEQKRIVAKLEEILPLCEKLKF